MYMYTHRGPAVLLGGQVNIKVNFPSCCDIDGRVTNSDFQYICRQADDKIKPRVTKKLTLLNVINLKVCEILHLCHTKQWSTTHI